VASAFIHTTISRSDWQNAAARHAERLNPILDPYLEKRSHGNKNPIMDFLFEYYSFAPARLREWSPGFGVAVTNSSPDELPNSELFTDSSEGLTLDPDAFPADRREAAQWIRRLLQNTQQQSPFFGCHGMHEWAMVYRADRIRHERVPLRMDDDELAEFVESQPIACTHFDAFRFFTPDARPMNTFRPSHDKMPELEQPGCIHTNMDVYRWAFKFYPWIPSDLIAEAFLTACHARTIDMRASPYDLRDYGLEPIRIETKEGRQQYRQLQREIFEEAKPLRKELLRAYDYLLEQVG
jgi:hypothetical protein